LVFKAQNDFSLNLNFVNLETCGLNYGEIVNKGKFELVREGF